MSARLVSNLEGLHELQDDLESSIYILLWTALMFSECSEPGVDYIGPFMAHVIDLQPHGENGGLGKKDFLLTRSYLHHLKFRHRPELDKLINELAQLFSVRYAEKPDTQMMLESSKLNEKCQLNPSLLWIYEKDPSYLYEKRMNLLMDPEHTIRFFNSVLCDRSKWPANDYATKQQFAVKKLSPPVIKTSWSTQMVMQEVDGIIETNSEMREGGDELEEEMTAPDGNVDILMVGVETSSETSNLDPVMTLL